MARKKRPGGSSPTDPFEGWAPTSLTEAIRTVRDHFEEQCGGLSLTLWHVLSATEDVAKGALVIRCVEHCAKEQGRAHEVWVDVKSGEIVHQHRIDLDPPSN